MSCVECGRSNIKIIAKGMCKTCYRKQRALKTPCCICGNDNTEDRIKLYDKMYCTKHYNQMKKYGEIKRTIYEPNEIKIYDNFATLDTYNKNGDVACTSKIDVEDVDRVSEYKWRCTTSGYVSNPVVGSLHRYVLGYNGEMFVDHINNDRSDNRKCNLRLCTNAENMRNMSNRKDGKIRGVVFSGSSWIAQIMFNRKNIYIGSYRTYEEACSARIEREIELFGDFSKHKEVKQYEQA